MYIYRVDSCGNGNIIIAKSLWVFINKTCQKKLYKLNPSQIKQTKDWINKQSAKFSGALSCEHD